MNRLASLFFTFVVAAALTPLTASAQSGNAIIFVGNSFTHGNYDPVMHYNNANVFDLNYGTSGNGSFGGNGGVPGIFQKMASSLGYACDVCMEATSGQNLEYHFTTRPIIFTHYMGKYKWVVLQDYSTEPTNDPNNPSGINLATFNQGVSDLKGLIKTTSPNAKIILYETFARADICGPVGNDFPSQAAMLSQLHTNYYAANTTYGLNGVAPVGDAWANAISLGYGHTNIYDGPVNVLDYPVTANSLKFTDGKFSLWHFYSTSNPEGYHPSIYGAYLAAAVFIEQIAGLDPRNIATGTGTAAGDLGISGTDAAHLHNAAYQTASVAPTITNGPTPATGAVGTGYNFSYALSAALPSATTLSLTSGTLPPGLTLTNGVLSGMPTLAGIYSGTVSATNGFGTPATQNFNIAISGNYNQWASYYSVGATTATPQNDGITNLIKYLCDIKPNASMTVADKAALPVTGTLINGGSTYLTITYRLNASAIGLQIGVQSSTNLANWGTAAFTTQTIGTDPVTHDSIVQVKVDVTGQPREFIRLNVQTS